MQRLILHANLPLRPTFLGHLLTVPPQTFCIHSTSAVFSATGAQYKWDTFFLQETFGWITVQVSVKASLNLFHGSLPGGLHSWECCSSPPSDCKSSCTFVSCSQQLLQGPSLTVFYENFFPHSSLLNSTCGSWCLGHSTLSLFFSPFSHLLILIAGKSWCWERLKVGAEGDDRGWDGWMVSPTQCTWVWVSSRSCWWTGKPGILRSMGSQRVRQDWMTELNSY